MEAISVCGLAEVVSKYGESVRAGSAKVGSVPAAAADVAAAVAATSGRRARIAVTDITDPNVMQMSTFTRDCRLVLNRYLLNSRKYRNESRKPSHVIANVLPKKICFVADFQGSIGIINKVLQ